jgi:hypothetical protein
LIIEDVTNPYECPLGLESNRALSHKHIDSILQSN